MYTSYFNVLNNCKINWISFCTEKMPPKKKFAKNINKKVNQKKKYCPRLMVRYDDTQTDYKTVFVCKICVTCILKESAVAEHLLRCKEENIVLSVEKR